jgi:hypothetical protein
MSNKLPESLFLCCKNLWLALWMNGDWTLFVLKSFRIPSLNRGLTLTSGSIFNLICPLSFNSEDEESLTNNSFYWFMGIKYYLDLGLLLLDCGSGVFRSESYHIYWLGTLLERIRELSSTINSCIFSMKSCVLW